MSLTPEEFEDALGALKLISARIVLKTRPGTIHWHIRKAGESGTLEVTLEGGRWTVEVRANRQGNWIPDIRRELSTLLDK